MDETEQDLATCGYGTTRCAKPAKLLVLVWVQAKGSPPGELVPSVLRLCLAHRKVIAPRGGAV